MKFIKKNNIVGRVDEAYFPDLKKAKEGGSQSRSSEERLADTFADALKDKVNEISEGFVTCYLKCMGYMRAEKGSWLSGVYNYTNNKYSEYLYPLFEKEPSRISRGDTAFTGFNDSLKVETAINMKKRELHVKALYSFDMMDLPNSAHYNPGIVFSNKGSFIKDDVTIEDVNKDMTERIHNMIEEVLSGEVTVNPNVEGLYRILQTFDFYLDEIRFFDGTSPNGTDFSNSDIEMTFNMTGFGYATEYSSVNESKKFLDDCMSYIASKFKFGCKSFSMNFICGYEISNEDVLDGVINPNQVLESLGSSSEKYIEQLENVLGFSISEESVNIREEQLDTDYVKVRYKRYVKYTIENNKIAAVDVNLCKNSFYLDNPRRRVRGMGLPFFISYCGAVLWFKVYSTSPNNNNKIIELNEIIPPFGKTSKINLTGRTLKIWEKDFYDLNVLFAKAIFNILEKYEMTH